MIVWLFSFFFFEEIRDIIRRIRMTYWSKPTFWPQMAVRYKNRSFARSSSKFGRTWNHRTSLTRGRSLGFDNNINNDSTSATTANRLSAQPALNFGGCPQWHCHWTGIMTPFTRQIGSRLIFLFLLTRHSLQSKALQRGCVRMAVTPILPCLLLLSCRSHFKA